MNKIDRLTVKYHNEVVGVLSLTPDDKRLAFEYDSQWIAEGFSISPLELPLKSGLFLAKPTPLYGNFGIFEDSLPDGYGRYLLHKALLREGIDDRNLSAIDRLSIVGGKGQYMGIGGDQESDTYLVHIGLPNGQLKRYVNAYCADLDDYDILIDMDIITETDFVITNKDGKTTFQFRSPSEGGVEL